MSQLTRRGLLGMVMAGLAKPTNVTRQLKTVANLDEQTMSSFYVPDFKHQHPLRGPILTNIQSPKWDEGES